MAHYIKEVSRTFGEYLLIPSLTTKECTPDNVSLKTPVVKFRQGETSKIQLNIPFVSAVMQAVSDDGLAIALARNGGLSFIFGSQPIESQAEMVRRVKKFKAGFVVSDSNLRPDCTLQDVVRLKEQTGHASVAITDDGTPNGKLLGMITSRDYRLKTDPLDKPVVDFMTPFENLIVGKLGLTLSEANTMLGAGINSRDFKERVPALVDAGVDVLVVDSSDGFSEWQYETIRWIKETYNEEVKVGGGNVVDKEGFLYLVKAGADFVKVGIGGGSICITREQKGIGRGQATALIEVCQARQEYFEQTGIYIPICSDGGLVHDYHMTLALAMGADFLMMGRYFARFDESPSKKLAIGNSYVKEYWGEGSNRAQNWQRYDMGGNSKAALKFEEGVDSYVPYAGKMKDNLEITLGKIKSTMCSCGSVTIPQLQERAKITLVSSTSIVEGGAHDVILKDTKIQ